MIKINVPFGMQGMVEAVYTPVFTPDVYPTDGDWVQIDYKIWEAMSPPNSLSISSEDTSTLAKSQLGLHITDSIGGFDVGASYQYTFLRKVFTDFSTIGGDGNLPLSWDRVHLFGAETAFVIAAFNIWAEIAYYMTSDFSGDNPLVHNNRFLYLFGFERDLMIHNISLNIQGKSELILGSDGVTDSSDIDYESDTAYNSHLLTAGLRDSFLNKKITAELNGSYYMEDGDFMIMPELRLNLVDDTWLNMKYTFFYGDSNTLFGQFEDNDFLEIRIEYSF